MKSLIIPLLCLSFLYVSCSNEAEQPLSVDNKITKEDLPSSSLASVPTQVDQLPLFGGASTKSASNQALIAYLVNNLKFPEEARASKTEGKVFVQFVVEEDGSVSNVDILKGIGGGCDEAAMAVVEGMNDLDISWSTPMHEGKASKVLYTLPISFRLES